MTLKQATFTSLLSLSLLQGGDNLLNENIDKTQQKVYLAQNLAITGTRIPPIYIPGKNNSQSKQNPFTNDYTPSIGETIINTAKDVYYSIEITSEPISRGIPPFPLGYSDFYSVKIFPDTSKQLKEYNRVLFNVKGNYKYFQNKSEIDTYIKDIEYEINTLKQEIARIYPAKKKANNPVINSENFYPEDSPTPNWPKKIIKKGLSGYCGPVNQAIIDGLNKLIDKAKTEEEKKEIIRIKNKFLSPEKLNLTEEELEIINKGYESIVDDIHFRSGYGWE